MKKIATILCLLPLLSHANVECVAKSEVFSNDTPVHLYKDLSVSFETSDIAKADAQIEEVYFTASEDKETKNYTLGIYFGPDYTRGVISKGTFSDTNELKLSHVNGNSVNTVICTKK